MKPKGTLLQRESLGQKIESLITDNVMAMSEIFRRTLLDEVDNKNYHEMSILHSLY